MQEDQIKLLLEKLGSAHYAASIRHMTKLDKRVKIPGFASPEKAPLQLIVNAAKKQPAFKKVLLQSISTIILSGECVDINTPVMELKETLSREKWLGLAAELLLSDKEEHVNEAQKIITEFTQDEAQEEPEKTECERKHDKKEDKFREKYLKAQKDLTALKELLEMQTQELRSSKDEIHNLEMLRQESQKRCNEYEAQIEKLKEEILILQRELEGIKVNQHQNVEQLCEKRLKKIFAPSCKDILEKYSNMLDVKFEAQSSEEIEAGIDYSDETWVCLGVLPFATARMLKKLEKSGNKKIIIFETVADLIKHVNLETQRS